MTKEIKYISFLYLSYCNLQKDSYNTSENKCFCLNLANKCWMDIYRDKCFKSGYNTSPILTYNFICVKIHL